MRMRASETRVRGAAGPAPVPRREAPPEPAIAPDPDGTPVWTRPTAALPLPAVSSRPADPPLLAPARFEAPPDAATVVVTAVDGAEGSSAAAAALACAGADGERAPLLVDLGGRPPRPTLVASAAARALEERLAAHLPATRVAARGQLCQLAPSADAEGFATAAAAVTVARGAFAVVHVPPAELQALLADPAAPRFSGALLRADVGAERPLLALLARDLRERGLAVAVLKRRLGWVTERRALFGALGPEGEGLSPSLVRRLTEPGSAGLGDLAQYGEGYGFGGGDGAGS